MASTKISKGATKNKAPNGALHSRVSYLYQAAMYLATQTQLDKSNPNKEVPSSQAIPTDLKDTVEKSKLAATYQPSARRLVSDLRGVSGKVLIRMSPGMKRSICKNCDSILVEGSTCLVEMENKSKGGKKRWADVLVRKCNTCGCARRYPLGERQKRRPHRALAS